ncbi:uncharacterized protein J7T54_005866 [Emericellopsis cladophorae]|uniref:Fungal N-terminal domain-containing protein n=1 Tax=Emericellopsis cladophorae TaxID=2686198 RepID=A0A9P9XW74_9HYPO|nr:uncharacterized protein J7T54_005866 [Emericellopsis cladophorae]KAI6778763.1 hypothetical protein J7T54_005866 [Emericellopsis cladophorae]
MEVLSAVAVATESASLCVKAITALKRFSNGFSTASEDLENVMLRVKHANNLLDIIRGLLIELKTSNVQEYNVIIPVEGLRVTLNEILDMAGNFTRQEARLSWFRKASWSIHRSRSLRLVQRLEQHQRELLEIINMIHVLYNVRSDNEIGTSIKEAKETSEKRSSFSSATLINDDTAQNTDINTHVPRTWLGHMHSDDPYLPEHYREMRSELADMAYHGEWDVVFDILQRARLDFNENWVNAPRMSESTA